LTPSELYDRKVAEKTLRSDPQQRPALRALDRLYADLMQKPERRGFCFWRKKSVVRGIYMHGAVGRGKSMLMELLFDALPDDYPKRRIHFHAFMIDVHAALNRARLENRADRGIPDYAKATAASVRVLCFDEFHVNDVADAMILGRLFTALIEQGVAVIATSNIEPDRLYEGGLQRDRFLPFIALVEKTMEIVPLTAGCDYRTQMLAEAGVYFTPLGDGTRARADALFAQLTQHGTVHQDVLEVKGRTIAVLQASGHTARFSFAQLCERPTGAADYIAIANAYTTVFLEGVPKLGYDRRNEAKRLITLIDVFYENHTRLIVTADATPEKLYLGHDHGFAFQRTVSRLIEMQSESYWRAAA
jgi:cell division protein ZapE